MTEIPESDRIRMPPSREPHPYTLLSVIEGKTLPTPDALLKHSELVDAFIMNIERQDAKARMTLLPAVEKYLTEIDNMSAEEIRDLTPSKSRQRLRLILAALGGAGVSTIFQSNDFLLQLISTYAIYYGLRKTLPDQPTEQNRKPTESYPESVRTRIVQAMHPNNPQKSLI